MLQSRGLCTPGLTDGCKTSPMSCVCVIWGVGGYAKVLRVVPHGPLEPGASPDSCPCWDRQGRQGRSGCNGFRGNALPCHFAVAVIGGAALVTAGVVHRSEGHRAPTPLCSLGSDTRPRRRL